MTSRAEYRLLLREDNADRRLTPIGRKIGLVSDERWEMFSAKEREFSEAMKMLRETTVTPKTEVQEKLQAAGFEPLRNAVTLEEFLRRPDISYDKLHDLFNISDLSAEVKEQVEISVKYAGYIEKQNEQIARTERMENKLLPEDTDYRQIKNLRDEAKEKLALIKPRSLGQAARISGVSPADIAVLMIYLEDQHRRREGKE